MRKSKVVHGFTRHFFKMLLPGSSASYGPHALQACEGTTLGVNDEFNGSPMFETNHQRPRIFVCNV